MRADDALRDGQARSVPIDFVGVREGADEGLEGRRKISRICMRLIKL
jgi:hypothetical protein